jgi:DNA topoisomerase-1
MANLVIVESPAKAKTIEKFLGSGWIVKSSVGHIRDMEKKNMGIDLDNGFTPTYVISPDKKKIVTDLKKSVKAADLVYLATDDDREGEAIAWHLQQALQLDENTPRIVFHEITKKAVLDAVKHPRTIDYSVVDAQQARRVIDRIVGFEISPVLWRKISGAKSAGRVQSPVVRIVAEREREINAFVPSVSFKSKAELLNGETIATKLNTDFTDEAAVQTFATALIDANLQLATIDKKPSKRSPKPPFTTSTLQQEASTKLGFSVKQTMTIAQNLYRQGFITYMRTDSLALSADAIDVASRVITDNFGDEFLHNRQYKAKTKGAQEAHEAIRPTDLAKPSIPVSDNGEQKLYNLIYKRTLASQMADAKLEKTKITIDISGRDEKFIAEGEVLNFAGFLKVYDYLSSEDKILPNLKVGDNLELQSFSAKQTFSKAKPRYTESSLVKTIEEMGIGRPSTFATMVSTVQDRGYVIKDSREGKMRDYQLITIENGEVITQTLQETAFTEKNKLFPTSVAYLLTDFLNKHFSDIVDYGWTAKLEESFDKIADNSKNWVSVVDGFYKVFHAKIEKSEEISREEAHNTRVLGNDPKTGKPISVRFGRYGPFAQIGDKDDEQAPVFASLKPHQDTETITLEEALELFKMPRVVGEHPEFGVIKANYGRFGPYIQYGKKYVSLKEISPEEVSLDEALVLIAAKEEFDAQRVIKTFEESEIEVLNGRFGPYIWNGKKRGKGQKNITIKKIFGETQDPKTLTLKQCQDAISGKLKPKTKTKAKSKPKSKSKSKTQTTKKKTIAKT